jgi:hypothetical protein
LWVPAFYLSKRSLGVGARFQQHDVLLGVLTARLDSPQQFSGFVAPHGPNDQFQFAGHGSLQHIWDSLSPDALHSCQKLQRIIFGYNRICPQQAEIQQTVREAGIRGQITTRPFVPTSSDHSTCSEPMPIAALVPLRTLISRIGGWPKNRLYSRLNWLGLS